MAKRKGSPDQMPKNGKTYERRVIEIKGDNGKIIKEKLIEISEWE